MRRLDKRGAITFLNVANPDTVCPIDRTLFLSRFHACENGQMLVGAAAFAAMWRAIPVLRPLGLIARYAPILWLLDRLYSAFLRVRPRIQRAMKDK
jgi:predicted DCC family thiol-disulfide oxidoreductase YuxK